MKPSDLRILVIMLINPIHLVTPAWAQSTVSIERNISKDCSGTILSALIREDGKPAERVAGYTISGMSCNCCDGQLSYSKNGQKFYISITDNEAQERLGRGLGALSLTAQKAEISVLKSTISAFERAASVDPRNAEYLAKQTPPPVGMPLLGTQLYISRQPCSNGNQVHGCGEISARALLADRFFLAMSGSNTSAVETDQATQAFVRQMLDALRLNRLK